MEATRDKGQAEMMRLDEDDVKYADQPEKLAKTTVAKAKLVQEGVKL